MSALRPNGSGSSAFTLVEMLLVLVIMSFFAGAIAVSLHGRADMLALRSATNDLASTIQYAARQAQGRGVPHRVALERPGKDSARPYAYRVQIWSDPGQEFVDAHGLAGQRHLLPEGISLGRVTSAAPGNSANTSVIDYLDFLPDQGFYGTLELSDRTGRVVTLQIMPVTAQVVVKP